MKTVKTFFNITANLISYYFHGRRCAVSASESGP